MLFLKKLPLTVVTILCLSYLKVSDSSPPVEVFTSCADRDIEFRHPDCEKTWTGNKYYIKCTQTEFDSCKGCECGRHTNEVFNVEKV